MSISRAKRLMSRPNHNHAAIYLQNIFPSSALTNVRSVNVPTKYALTLRENKKCDQCGAHNSV